MPGVVLPVRDRDDDTGGHHPLGSDQPTRGATSGASGVRAADPFWGNQLRHKRLGLAATAAALVAATTACEPAPTPWRVALVSMNAAGTGPGDSSSRSAVLFHSMLNTLTSLPAGNGGYDYFLRDRVAGTTTVVSVAASGEATGNDSSGESWHRALMTPDGNKVAFESNASNLVFPPVYTTGSDIFVRDLTTGTTIHVAANVEQLRGLSADGTRVLFSTREALVPDDGNGVNGWDLYLADLASGTTVLVSANADGIATGAPPAEGTLAPDGDGVLFVSSSSDVVPGVDTNGVDDVYLRDLATGTVRAERSTRCSRSVDTSRGGTGGAPACGSRVSTTPSWPPAPERTILHDMGVEASSQAPILDDALDLPSA